jgi:DNA-binding LacI/PurR family transcriptional regulator
MPPDRDAQRRASRPTVTIKDVATAAGVSPSTVSHTFSGRRAISEATRKRVLAAADDLGYVPNAHARQLRLGRSNMLGLVLRPRYAVAGTPDAAETFNRLSGAMATASLRRGLGLVHVPDISGSGHDLPPMDGCIVAHPYADDRTIDILDNARVPYVLADPDPARRELPWVVAVDYAVGVRKILELAAGADNRHVVLLPGTEANAWNTDAEQTYRAWCSDVGQEPEVTPMSEGATPADVRETVRKVIGSHGGELALVYGDSSATPAVLSELDKLGRRVPEDVSLATLTDTVHTRVASPPVTGMDLAHEELAERAVALLAARLAGEGVPADAQLVEPVVTERASTRR